MHRLLLHDKGHGCGGFNQNSEFDDYLSLASDSSPYIKGKKVRQYSKTHYAYVEGDSYPLKNYFEERKFPFTGSIEGLQQQLNPREYQARPIGYFLDSLQPITPSFTRSSFIFPINERTHLSGTPKLKLRAMVSVPDTAIYVDVMVIRQDGTSFTLNNVQRSGVVWSKPLNSIEEITITLPPTLATLAKGSKVYIQFSTKKPWIYHQTTPEREKTLKKQGYGKVIIFSGTELFLPVEKEISAIN